MRAAIVSIVVLAACAIIAGCLYCKLSYIDDIVDAGSAHGFVIGATKSDASESARRVLVDADVWIRDPETSGPMRALRLTSDVEWESLQQRTEWRLFFGGDPFDSLTLTFEGDRLVRIYRHRNRCELP